MLPLQKHNRVFLQTDKNLDLVRAHINFKIAVLVLGILATSIATGGLATLWTSYMIASGIGAAVGVAGTAASIGNFLLNNPYRHSFTFHPSQEAPEQRKQFSEEDITGFAYQLFKSLDYGTDYSDIRIPDLIEELPKDTQLIEQVKQRLRLLQENKIRQILLSPVLRIDENEPGLDKSLLQTGLAPDEVVTGNDLQFHPSQPFPSYLIDADPGSPTSHSRSNSQENQPGLTKEDLPSEGEDNLGEETLQYDLESPTHQIKMDSSSLSEQTRDKVSTRPAEKIKHSADKDVSAHASTGVEVPFSAFPTGSLIASPTVETPQVIATTARRHSVPKAPLELDPLTVQIPHTNTIEVNAKARTMAPVVDVHPPTPTPTNDDEDYGTIKLEEAEMKVSAEEGTKVLQKPLQTMLDRCNTNNSLSSYTWWKTLAKHLDESFNWKFDGKKFVGSKMKNINKVESLSIKRGVHVLPLIFENTIELSFDLNQTKVFTKGLSSQKGFLNPNIYHFEFGNITKTLTINGGYGFVTKSFEFGYSEITIPQ